MDGVFIHITVILAGAKSSVFLFNKEERRGLGRIGRAELSRSEVLVQKVFGGFSFIRGEGVYLPDFRGEGVVEVDFMIIGSRGGNVVGGFF